MNKKSRPLVSIIIPVYNRASLVAETLDSVLSQIYTNWECIIVDDGSTDLTKDVVRKYVEKDIRYKLFDRPDSHKPGGNGARNFGFEVSNGEYIQWLDSDDVLEKNKIYNQIKLIIDEPKTTIIFSTYSIFKTETRYAKPKKKKCFKNYDDPIDYIKFYCLNGQGFYTGCILAHRNLILNTGGWNEELMINQDGEFLIKAAIQSKKIKYDRHSMVYYRDNPDGKRLSTLQDKAFRIFDSIKYITDYILENTAFTNKAKYCASLFVRIVVVFPGNECLKKMCDKEVNLLGGDYYLAGSLIFKLLWKLFGRQSALIFNTKLSKLKFALKGFLNK